MHAIFRSIRKREIILQQETTERRYHVREFPRERKSVRTVSDEIEPKRHLPVRARKLRQDALFFDGWDETTKTVETTASTSIVKTRMDGENANANGNYGSLLNETESIAIEEAEEAGRSSETTKKRTEKKRKRQRRL